jgi:hypothetical protein
MQEFELIAVALLVVVVILAIAMTGASYTRRHRQVAVGLIIGLVAAVLVLAPREDIWPDQFQDQAQFVLILGVSGVLAILGLRRRRTH